MTMVDLFRFSPSRLALYYVALSTLVLALFAIPLWYAWSVNLATFRQYVATEDVARMVGVFEREGAAGLAAAIDAQAPGISRDGIVVLADPSKARLAGNLPEWPAEVPDLPGTYGLAIGGHPPSMRIVASHIALPGGYHLLVGRESARFQSLVDSFWFGIAGATVIVLVIGALIGWLIRRALLFEVREMSATARAIVAGDPSRRLATRRSNDALAALARTVNDMLEQLARQNVRLAEEVGTRRRAERALQRAHQDLEDVIEQRTGELRQTNESFRRSEAYLAEAQHLARVGSFGIKIETRELVCSEETMRIAAFEPGSKPTLETALARVHPEDRTRVESTIERGLADRSLLEYEHRLLLPDGSIRHVRVVGHTIYDASNAPEFVGAVVDITERKATETLLAGEKRLLEVIAKGAPLAETLDALCRLAEDVDPDWWVSILLLDRDPRRFRHGAAPSLPKGYCAQIDGAAVGPGIGPCALAAHLQKQVISADLRTDERWSADFRALASAHGLRACWSTPIASSDGRVLGTFAIYSHERSSPTLEEQSRIERLTHLASIAIERSAANDALRRSEERYALAMDAAGDGHIEWIVATDEFYASPRFLGMCGFGPDTTFHGRADFLARLPLHPEDRDYYINTVNAHFAGTSIRVELEVRIVRRGETRWLHLTGLCTREESGALARWNAAFTDVTERKRSADELRARQDMLDLAQKAARAVAFEWRIGAGDGENRWSPDLEALYGMPPGSYDGTYESWKSLIYGEDWAKVRGAIKRAQLSGDVDAEYRVVHPNGALRWLQAKGRMFFDPDGKPTRVVGFMLDVTDRHLAHDKLRRMERELRQAQRLEGMGTLAGGIAHDFNNLLGAILGYGEMALSEAPAGSRLRRDVENIMIAGERGRALVDRILAFSRSGVGERVAVDVEEVIGETIALVGAKLPPPIAIKQRLNAGGAAVLGDPTQIHQVVMNLLTNAAQAMPGGGTLGVTLERVPVRGPRSVTTGSVGARDYVVLSVTDTGSGIAPEVLDRIFDPFFTTKEVGVGSGLGLSLVHGIVTGLGGAIDVATTVGAGSDFRVYLPLADEVTGTGANKSRKRVRPKEQQAGYGRVLIVDDEEALVKLASETLTALGYATAGFTASAAALAAFRADPERFDAVITDESMPGISGAELIREIRSLRPTLPIVLVSGYLSTAVVERAREAGATDVLKKPLSAHDLTAALDAALRAARARDTSDVAASASPGRL